MIQDAAKKFEVAGVGKEEAVTVEETEKRAERSSGGKERKASLPLEIYRIGDGTGRDYG
jgi:hypothetical protein